MSEIIKGGGVFSIALIIGFLILVVMMIIAVLKIPKIARYTKAQLKLNVLKAKQEGVSLNALGHIVNEAEKASDGEAQEKAYKEYRLKD